MFLSSKDGIICDYCGTIYRDQFIYYSVSDIRIKIVNSMRVARNKGNLPGDMCASCYDRIIDDVKANLGPIKKGKIKCDLSKQYKSGTFEYHFLLFDRVDIDKKRSNEISIDKKVMDLTIIDAYNKLQNQAEVTKKKIEKEGVWS